MPNPVPLLLTYLFGESAPVAFQGASERLKVWAAAFDAWLEELLRRFKPVTVQQYRLAWQRLLAHNQKLPWELTQADIQAHLAWLEGEDYSPFTVYASLKHISAFYHWCSLHAVDPACPGGFNPADGVSIPFPRRYAALELLSREEVRVLLAALRRDQSPIGLRDYAFILARLRLGVPLSYLQMLRWRQVELAGDSARLRWRAGCDPVRLPGEVWEAIQRYLSVSGRLPILQPGSFVFAPLDRPEREQIGDRASDWREGMPLVAREFWHNLKRWGAQTRIKPEKLTLEVLRLTAVRLKLDEGCSLEDIQAFMDSRSPLKIIKYRLKFLPELPPDPPQTSLTGLGSQVLSHKQALYQPGDGFKHGFYAHSQPPEMVKAILSENIQGIEAELVGLRLLGRCLLERQAQAGSTSEMVRLGDAYTLLAARLADLLRIEREMAEGNKGWKEKAEQMENFFKMLDQMAQEGAKPARQAALDEMLGSEAGQEIASRRLAEEIAATRCVLRLTLDLALQAESSAEVVHLVNIYASACSRLVRMLRLERGDEEQLLNYVQAIIRRAIDETAKDWSR
jgi:site-specific recombinase XerD